MQSHSWGVGDSVDEAVEELNPTVLTALFGVVALSFENRNELRPGLEEPAPLAHTLEGTVKKSGPRAVTVGQ